MKYNNSFISTGLLALVLFCFFLPFTDISCNNTRIARITGKEFITGTHIKLPDEFNNELKGTGEARVNTYKAGNENVSAEDGGDYIAPNGWIIAAFCCAIAGLVFGVLIRGKKSWVHLLFSLGGMVALIGFQIKTNHQFNQQSNGELFKLDVHVDYLAGYWLVLIVFGLILGNSLFSIFSGPMPLPPQKEDNPADSSSE